MSIDTAHVLTVADIIEQPARPVNGDQSSLSNSLTLLEAIAQTRGRSFGVTGEFRNVAPRPLNVLFERSGASAVHLAILCGRDGVYLEKITRPAGTPPNQPRRRAIATISRSAPTAGAGRVREANLDSFGRLSTDAAGHISSLLPA